MRRATALIAALLAAGLSACGGSTATSTSTTTAGAPAPATATTTSAAGPTIAKTETKVEAAATLADAPRVMAEQSGLTADQAGCVVTELVDAVGGDRALALVNDASDLSDLPAGDRKVASDALLACVDRAAFATVIANGFYEDLQDAGITREQAQCVGTKLMEVLTPEALVGMGTDTLAFDQLAPADQGKLFQVFIDCVPPEVLGQLAADNPDVATSVAG